MRIKNISLRNGYKRFFNMNINLGSEPKKIIALVGRNGSGKSSVFDGMLYIQNRFGLIGQHSAQGETFHSMNQDIAFDQSWEKNVEIEFDTGGFRSVHTEKEAAGIPKTIFAFRGPYRYCSNLKVNTLSRIADIKENNTGASSTIDFDDKITVNYQRLFTLVDRKLKEKNLRYSEAKAQVIGEFNLKLKRVIGIEIVDHGDIINGKGTLYFTKKDQPQMFEFNVLSSGEKEVVDILLDIFLRSETYSETIYIIDEPELHLNTSIQRGLLNEIVSMVPEKSQLWIATHSIGFLNSLKQDHSKDAEIVWFEGNFGSESVSLFPMKKTRENWKKIFQTALEDLTGLLSPKQIIYCEGRKEPGSNGEEQGLDAEVYNTIFEGEYPDTLFVSSGGQTEPDLYSEIALLILGKAFNAVEILVLKDKDINSSGLPTNDEARLAWLSKSVNRRMLKRKEIENYLLDFEIVSSSYQTLTKENYEKIISDINTQDVKSKTSEIMKLCIGGGNISKQIFLQNLAKHITPKTDVYRELKNIIFNSPILDASNV